ncbi:MAG: hypothetical protein IJY58_05840 [Alphaproteobacteria bacterium]|nr:hypothetical protein [Alphaproteobacteria bacterium]
MKIIKWTKFLIVSLIICCFSLSAMAVMECCPNPPKCIPTQACPLEMKGNIAAAQGNKFIQAVTSGYEKVASAYRTVRQKIVQTRRAVTAAVDKVKNAVVSTIQWPFKKLGNVLGLTKDENAQTDDDPEGVTQDKSHGEDISVHTRMERNLGTYDDETRADYASEYFVVQRRKFIRQQATITLMARMLTLKANFETIKDILEKIDAQVDEDEKNSGASDGDKMSVDKNTLVILRSNEQLRLAWFELLVYQKMIEAVKLEFAANQAISSMKIVKKVPKISANKGDGGTVNMGDKK